MNLWIAKCDEPVVSILQNTQAIYLNQMNEILKIIPSVLYFIIGCVSMIMAVKSLSSKQFLPFHQKAYGKSWDDVDKNLQDVIIALLKTSGLGFLVVSLLLLSFPVVCYFNSSLYVKYAVIVPDSKYQLCQPFKKTFRMWTW